MMNHALLRLVSNNGATIQIYPLEDANEVSVEIGRDPSSCQIVLDSNVYPSVSRRHANITSSYSPQGRIFTLKDLNSSCGTYLNNKRLQSSQELRNGDRIRLGEDGSEFIFEHKVLQATVAASFSGGNNKTEESGIFPIGSKEVRKQLFAKGFLIPGIITVIFVVLLFVARVNSYTYRILLGSYLALAALFFTYQLCGKRKPWWVMTGSAFLCIIILKTVYFPIIAPIFYNFLPGNLSRSQSLIPALIGSFVGAGMSEELTKALPILIFYLLGRRLAEPTRTRVGVEEPLDGILLGAASATGFTLLETLGLYIPREVVQVGQQLGVASGELAGLQLLIPRILGQIAGHMAWSGWFGYCIGLSILKPNKRWRSLIVGYLSAALLHGLWNSGIALARIIGIFVLVWWVLIGGFSYALLIGAILKARTISPTRSSNFATRFFQ